MFVTADPVDRDDLYMTTQELAARWRVQPETLANARARGEGLPFTTPSGRPLYRLADVLRVEQDNLRGFTWAALEAVLREAPGVAPSAVDSIIKGLKERVRAG